MPWYAPNDDDWTQRVNPPDAGLALQIRADEGQSPELRLAEGTEEVFHLTGVKPRPGTDTTHTAARVDPEAATGTRLFAVHADGNDLTFEDYRPAAAKAEVDDGAIHHVQSALNEILIPVYIDDVISDLSERASGLFVIHTAQYDGETQSSWTYTRTALFEDGTLLLEDEHGAL